MKMINKKITLTYLLFCSLLAWSQEYDYEATVKGTKSNSFHKIALSPELLGKLRSDQTDLRIYDTTGIELPYFSEQEEPVEYKNLFREYKILKKDYRKYHIKTVVGPDDFKSMNEIVHRRYSRLLNEGSKLPNLIVIDGDNAIDR